MTDRFDYAADLALHGAIAVPDGDHRRPGVVVFHDINGVTAHPRGWADRIAGELGYVALAADVYGEGANPTDFGEGLRWIGGLRDDPATLHARAAAALTALAAHPRCDGRIAAIGFCFGGMVVLELARAGAPGLLAGVSLHGVLQTTTKVAAGALTAKLLVLHGAEDPMADYAALTAFLGEMRDAAADCQTVAFTGVVHAFTRPDQDGSMPALKFNAAANARSWQMMAAHLAEAFA